MKKEKYFTFHLMTMKCIIGIHLEIAEAKSTYWSTFAPNNPVDVVLAAGEKAKVETSNVCI